MRSVSWLALVVGLLLVPASIAIALNEHDSARNQQQSRLDDAATTHAAAIDAYFTRARSITLLTASVDDFRDAMVEPGGRKAIVTRQSAQLSGATRQLAYLERLYPGSIGEACFIVSEGGELTRVVAGKVAPVADLSPDESQSVFFAPTFAMNRGSVYQAMPYRSPDMHEWVISNSTPVYAPGASAPGAIVHFEVTLESFRRELATARSGDQELRIVDTATGAVIADADHPQLAKAPLGAPDDHRFASIHAGGRTVVDGHLAAVKPIDRHAGNANHWVVVASTRRPFPSLLESLGPAAIALLLGGLALIVFAALGLRAARRELEEAAHTDGLTGLPNRRSLVADLERIAARATDDAPVALLLFDLDGFKGYNDTFGHLAGDALLARLGGRLAEATAPFGQAYRLGGDEFCVVGDGRQLPRIEAAASAALSEAGEGFGVTSSYGAVLVPDETSDPVEALRVADQRMYQHKGIGRAGAEDQSKAVLLRMLIERDPELGQHVGGVAELAADVASELGVLGDDLRDLIHAAELHDIGKMAVPDAILNKPGPLDDAEWQFMRTHTLIGERILAAAPALAQVAKLVRSSHERWDGGGYPDNLAGDDIPLGARIVFACDAFDAIISDRPYARARNIDEAVAELRANAGSQFDPAVVTALIAVAERVKRPAVPVGAARA
jgi:diguanylate cyclase (GGDEF)-like protein